MTMLPMKCKQYLSNRGIVYDQIEDGANKGVVIRDFKLPEGKFDASTADILILLPASYPDSPPDMFHALPWLRLSSTNGYARAADQPVHFNGLSWQRWSRHNNAWRAGIDGIWTMLKRVETALEVAA